MTLLTRIEGPITASRLLPILTTSVGRTKSTLLHRRALKQEQMFARELRRQQEDAYTNSLKQDQLREEQQRVAIMESERIERKRQQELKEKEKRRTGKEMWRLWMAGELKRRGVVGMKSEIGKTARVGLRMINGERIVQMFPGDFTLEQVYAFVECYDLLFPHKQPEGSEGSEGVTLRKSREEQQLTGSSRQESSTTGEGSRPEGYEHEFMFRLVVPYPRKVIDCGGTLVKNESGLWPSGSIVVEEIEEDEESCSEEDSDSD